MDGRKAGHQRDPGIAGFRQSRLRRGFTLVFSAAIGAEVPGDVVVEIDPSRQNSQAAEIIESGIHSPLVFGILLCPHNLAILDNNQNVVQDVSFAIKHCAGTDNSRRLLGNGRGYDKKDKREDVSCDIFHRFRYRLRIVNECLQRRGFFHCENALSKKYQPTKSATYRTLISGLEAGGWMREVFSGHCTSVSCYAGN